MRTDALWPKSIIAAFFLVITSNCGTSELGTGVSNPPSSTTVKSAAAAVASVFSGMGSDENVIAALKIVAYTETDFDGQPCPDNDPACTCSQLDEGGPSQVETVAFGDAGTYGSEDYSVSLAATDFCELSDGTENSGSGPDGLGKYATFEIIADVSMTCTGEDTAEIAMTSGSVGVFRNTVATDTTPAYQPQIYGAFIFDVDGTEVTVNCAMFLAEDETVLFADCSDENGEAIVQDSDASCQVQSDS